MPATASKLSTGQAFRAIHLAFVQTLKHLAAGNPVI